MIASLWRNLVAAMLVYGPVAMVLLAIFLVAREYDVGFFQLTRDPFAGQASTVPWYTSILSNLGIIGWCFTIAVQFFAALIAFRSDCNSRPAWFLFWAGIITLVLMLDDLLMLHERLDHAIETVIFGAYGAWVGLIMLRFRQVIFSTNYIILGLALVCFAFSMVLDNIFTRLSIGIPYQSVLEDAFKIMGIFGWGCYFVKLAKDSVIRTLHHVVT